ncbi:MAG: M55 family metallopeptidase [Clostridiales bacterium]|nr:M55 family metallopeptidase [Clostridiales bacterium]
MNILIITDLESVAGIVDKDNWTRPGSTYYQKAIRLLTKETNAAIRGFFDGGATNVYVLDGHGPGALDIELLDERSYYVRGLSSQLIMREKNINALAWVGQHAKASTKGAHMAHTGNFTLIDYQINGISVGEFGRICIGGGTLGIKAIFGAGDSAFQKEAIKLCKGIETIVVKEAFDNGDGLDLPYEEYYKLNTGAIHVQPLKARKMIYEGAKKAAIRFKNEPNSFTVVKVKPPYTLYQKKRDVYNTKGYESITKGDTFEELINNKEKVITNE